MPAQALLFTLLMLAAGIAIPVMAALNSGLGVRIGSPALAAVILLGVGLGVALIVLAVQGMPPAPGFGAVPPVYFLGGLIVALYITSITFAAPVLGVGNAVFLVLLGQLGSAALIDHFGLFGAVPAPLDWRRGLGLAAMALGVYLARRPG